MQNLVKLDCPKSFNQEDFFGKIIGNVIGNSDKKALTAVPLAKYFWPKLITKATSSVLDKFERKKMG